MTTAQLLNRLGEFALQRLLPRPCETLIAESVVDRQAISVPNSRRKKGLERAFTSLKRSYDLSSTDAAVYHSGALARIVMRQHGPPAATASEIEVRVDHLSYTGSRRMTAALGL
ncbi:MAG: hypothetical protein ACTHK7_00040 [Aureliella sp.]